MWPWNPKIMSYQVWTLWDHSFLSYAADISVKNALIDPVTLIFQPQNHTISRISQGYSLYQVWTLWDLSFLSYAVDRQTDWNILPTLTVISMVWLVFFIVARPLKQYGFWIFISYSWINATSCTNVKSVAVKPVFFACPLFWEFF